MRLRECALRPLKRQFAELKLLVVYVNCVKSCSAGRNVSTAFCDYMNDDCWLRACCSRFMPKQENASEVINFLKKLSKLKVSR